MPDKIIFTDKDLTIELPSEPAKITDLAKVLIECRHATSFAKSDISDKAIEKILEVSFYLSMRPDEGRYPHIRLTTGTEKDSRLTVKLEKPISFSDVHELRRLTPAAESPNFALLITELDDELLCLGLANIGKRGYGSEPGRPEIIPVGGRPSLNVWIEGPGHIFVAEGSNHLEFRAGRARLVLPIFSYISVLRELSADIGKALHQISVQMCKDIDDADKYFGGEHGLTGIVKIMLSKILNTCLELRHGGAFVLLPKQNSSDVTADIICKYPLISPDLGEDIANYWSIHIEAFHSKKISIDEYNKKLQACNIRKANLLNDVDSVAHMSSADGCVVMTHDLRIVGFGGSIVVSEDESKKTKTKVKLSNDQECSIDEFLNNVGGQRHQSAARLVVKHLDAIAFVISQDGELSVFSKDKEGYVRVFRPVDPSYTPNSE